MRQDPEAPNAFFVANGETIIITFEAVKVPDTPLGDSDRVHVAADGTLLPKEVDADKRTVECRIVANQKTGKSHFLLYECVFFTTTDPAGAKYVIRAAGVAGGQSSGPFKAAAATQLSRSGEIWFTVE